ncbi:uncharacterized protein LOC132757153 [Ruditapes philippinarum]|uniref:uncharacterized protein LOC132757153 n=1 Tax=Ruditapes philippinarum TaxID=129788 RepID=UPI00295B7B89|nr:uncharacterized protein LOC132757153 [Ruditapes philippinarum]
MDKGKDDVDEAIKPCSASAIYYAVSILVVSLLGFGTAKIGIGLTNLNNCTIEKCIPVYLVISGVAPLMFSGLSCKGKGVIETCGRLVCGCFGFFFSFAWLICGTVWVYPTYGVVMSKDFKVCQVNETTGCSHEDCDKYLLRFAVAMVSIDWLLLVMWIGLIFWYICKDNRE